YPIEKLDQLFTSIASQTYLKNTIKHRRTDDKVTRKRNILRTDLRGNMFRQDNCVTPVFLPTEKKAFLKFKMSLLTEHISSSRSENAHSQSPEEPSSNMQLALRSARGSSLVEQLLLLLLQSPLTQLAPLRGGECSGHRAVHDGRAPDARRASNAKDRTWFSNHRMKQKILEQDHPEGMV
ncbi:hypothetical protein A6R68_20412, partial [Neotoma lepida]